MYSEKQLLDLKKDIDAAKAEINKLKGQEAAYLTQLKEDYKCNSLEAAKKKIEKLKTTIAELETKIEEKSKVLEEKYFTDED